MHKGELVPLYSPDIPETCSECGSELNKNKDYDRHIFTSLSTLKIPVTYFEPCEECGTKNTPEIVGVEGSKNYADDYLSKCMDARYEGKNSLHNTRRVAEIFAGDTNIDARAPCPTTLWTYEQERGKTSLKKLRETDVSFDGSLHIDGFWVRCGWRKFIEENMGKEFTDRQWKQFQRQKVIYVIATEDKVILDFVITEPKPPSFWLEPILKRMKKRLGEENIKKVVSDEDPAIINAVNRVLPNAAHGFCVFHQLKNYTEKFYEKFDDIEDLDDLPRWAKKIYDKGVELITAEDAVNSSVTLKIVKDLLDNSPSEGFREFKKEIREFLENKYRKNKEYLEAGFVPDTNNVMEQIFSFFEDFAHRVKSFKIVTGLKSSTANLSHKWNHREFNTGKHAGRSPISISQGKDPP